jgi:hypothetical protein
VRRAAKDNIIHVHLKTIRISSPCQRRKRVISTLPISKPLLNKNPHKQPYQAWGACFSPYNAFLSLYTLWENSALSKPGGCWGPCVVRGPVDGRFFVWWVIDNVVWTDS